MSMVVCVPGQQGAGATYQHRTGALLHFSYDSFTLESEEKDLLDFMTMRARMGGEALSYQMAKQQGLSPDLEIGVGCELQGELRSYAVIGSRITSDGDLLETG